MSHRPSRSVLPFAWSLLALTLTGLSCSAGREVGAPGIRGFSVRFNGIQCVTHPCFNIDVRPLDGGGAGDVVSDVDLSRLELTSEELDAVQRRLASPDGIQAEGAIEVVPDAGPAGDGRVFRVERLIDPRPPLSATAS